MSRKKQLAKLRICSAAAVSVPLLAALMPSVSAADQVVSQKTPPIARGNIPTDAQDTGAVEASTPMAAMIWLKTRNQVQFDSAVAERYDPSSPFYHHWMTPQEVASYGPSPHEVAILQESLRAQGLKIERVADDDAAIKVSGSAAQIHAAFGTSVHKFQSAGQTFLHSVTEPTYQGAHAELVGSVSTLGDRPAQSGAVRQIDLSSGQPRAGVRAGSTINPLAAFTNKCFGRETKLTLSGGNVTATYQGPQYLPQVTSADSRICGYTAMQVARHYGLDEVYALGWTGKGQTIVLIDPGFSPTIQADANAFNQAMGLPELNSSNFQIIQPDGPQEIPGFASTEVSLDIEWAHALAPDANIVLLAPKNATDPEIAFAIDYAVTHQLGNVISDSFGTPEVFETVATAQMYNTVIEKAAAQGIAFNAITQDHGDSNLGTPVGAAVVPADSPFATAVGGTSIDVPTEDGLVDTAWGTVLTALVSSPGSTGTLPLLSMASSPAPETPLSSLRPLPVFGGGGGESNFFDKPAYQKKLPGTGRQTPDVSAIADGFTGVIIAVPNISIDPTTGVESVNGSEFVGAGGTSLAAPVFSAIWALANQAAREPLGQAAPIIARLPSFALTDILPIVVRPKDNTSGSITVTDPTTSTSSTTSYDPAQLLGLEKSQPQGFVGFLSPMNVDPESGPLNDLGFGADTSLRATVGWDNATGWGEPKGLAFILAARALAKGGY